MRDLSGKTAFVTGGNRGIGRGVAEALAAAGMRVSITGRDEEALAATLAALDGKAPRRDGDSGPVGLGAVADVRQPASLQEAVDATMARFGSIDVVVANAGVGAFGSVIDLDPEAWHAVIDTNLTGVFNTVKATVEPLMASSGLLVTIGSLAGANFFAGGSAYNASKFGLLGFTQAVMLDLRDRGVRVSTIMPGSVATHFSGRDPTPEEAWKLHPDDIAETVLYLARLDARALPSRIEIRPSRPARR